jgi:hypothetical protein
MGDINHSTIRVKGKTMSRTLQFTKALGGAGLVALLAGSVNAAELTSTADEIAALEAQLAAKKAELAQEVRDDQIRLLADEASADAATRSFYMNGPASVGFEQGKGFMLSDQAGENTMAIGFYSQFRYVANFQNDSSTDPNVDGTSTGFEFRRNRIQLQGKMAGKFGYKLSGDFGQDGMFELKDAYFSYELDPGWTLLAGQFKAPVLYETMVSSTKQLAVERSAIDNVFGADRTQGVALQYMEDNFRFIGSFNDGANSDNTSWSQDQVDGSVTGRIDYVVEGDWKQFDDFTSNRSSDFGLRIGGAAHYQDGDVGDDASPDSLKGPFPNVFVYTIDAQAEFQGASLYASFIGVDADSESGGDDVEHYGFLVQGSYYLTEQWELFGRWEYFDLDGISDEPSLITIGLNNYIDGHYNKCSIDFGFATDTVPSLLASDNTGWETDADGKDGQVLIRAQWQIVF